MNTSKHQTYTVAQMAMKLKLSRPRFYQLTKDGIFPPPVYAIKTQKPLYPTRLQQICIDIRKTGIGYNGKYVRFYRKRKPIKVEFEHRQIAAALRELGLIVNPEHVKKTLKKLRLPVSKAKADDPETIHMLFNHFNSEC